MLPSCSGILSEAINTMHLTVVSNSRMKKEIHYIQTRPITKAISTGNLKQSYFYLHDPSWRELIVRLQILVRF